jgi:hypothetical protein
LYAPSPSIGAGLESFETSVMMAVQWLTRRVPQYLKDGHARRGRWGGNPHLILLKQFVKHASTIIAGGNSWAEVQWQGLISAHPESGDSGHVGHMMGIAVP